MKLEVEMAVLPTVTNKSAKSSKTRKGSCDKDNHTDCLLYTSPSPRDRQKSRMPSSA